MFCPQHPSVRLQGKQQTFSYQLYESCTPRQAFVYTVCIVAVFVAWLCFCSFITLMEHLLLLLPPQMQPHPNPITLKLFLLLNMRQTSAFGPRLVHSHVLLMRCCYLFSSCWFAPRQRRTRRTPYATNLKQDNCTRT